MDNAIYITSHSKGSYTSTKWLKYSLSVISTKALYLPRNAYDSVTDMATFHILASRLLHFLTLYNAHFFCYERLQ